MDSSFSSIVNISVSADSSIVLSKSGRIRVPNTALDHVLVLFSILLRIALASCHSGRLLEGPNVRN